MIGVHDFALVAERGAKDADGVAAVGLDFEMEGTERLHDGYTILHVLIYVKTIYTNVWLQMKCKQWLNPLGKRGYRELVRTKYD
jgi:hypothetical protein